MADSNSVMDAIGGSKGSSQYWGASSDTPDKAQVASFGLMPQQAQPPRQPTSDQQVNTQSPSAQGQQTPGTPVTANGGIPPYTPPPVPAAPTYQASAVPTATSYQNDARYIAPQAAQVTYDAMHFDAPSNQGHLEAGQNSLINAILANPHTLNDNAVAQMKEQQKEQALLLGKQGLAGLVPNMLARGVQGSGQIDALRANNEANVNSNILTGNRDVDLKKIATDRSDELSALGAADSVANNQFGRASQGFGLNADQQYKGYSSRAKANDDAFSRAAAIAQAAQGAYGQDVQQNEFGTNLANSQNEFARQLGLNYDQLGVNANNSQNALLAAIMNG